MRYLPAALLFSATFLATVSSAQSSLTILNNGFPIGAVGQSYAQALSASGGTQPYAWSATGQIPPGLTVNSVGTISGTPRTGGSYSFTLTVVDARQVSASKTLSIVISGPGPAPLTVTSTNLPAGAVGQSYTQTLTATGGTPPYQWAAGTDFPRFLTLDRASGTLSGTPTASGLNIFSVTVTDSANLTATGTVSLPINNGPPRITTQSPIFGGTVGVPYVQTFQATGGNPPVYLDDHLGRRGRFGSRSCNWESAGNTTNHRYFQLHNTGCRSIGHYDDTSVFAGRQSTHVGHHDHFVIAAGRCRRPV